VAEPGYRPAATIAGVPWWTIACCGLFGLLVLCASVAALVATIRLLGSLGRLGSALEAVTLEIERRTRALSARGETTAAGLEELNEAVARLAASRERLGILVWALEDVRRLVTAYRLLSPTK